MPFLKRPYSLTFRKLRGAIWGRKKHFLFWVEGVGLWWVWNGMSTFHFSTIELGSGRMCFERSDGLGMGWGIAKLLSRVQTYYKREQSNRLQVDEESHRKGLTTTKLHDKRRHLKRQKNRKKLKSDLNLRKWLRSLSLADHHKPQTKQRSPL